MGAFLRNSFAHVDNVIPVVKPINHMAASVKVATRQTHRNFRNLPNPPGEPSKPCLRNLHQHALAPGTYHFTPEPYWNLPPEPTPPDTGTLRNLLEPSKTLRNLPPEPAPATRTGAHRSLSGLKTPLGCGVGEKCGFFWKNEVKNK